MIRRRRELDSRLHAIERMLDKVDRSIERIEIVSVVREPNNTVAADAYNGLRKQIIAATGERNAHLVQLAHLDDALREGVGPADLAVLVAEWVAQASLAVVTDLRHEGAFEVVGPDDGDQVVVARPAYVDTATGRVVRRGIAERTRQVAEPRPEPRSDPRPDPAPVPAAAAGAPDADDHHDGAPGEPAAVQQRGDGQ